MLAIVQKEGTDGHKYYGFRNFTKTKTVLFLSDQTRPVQFRKFHPSPLILPSGLEIE